MQKAMTLAKTFHDPSKKASRKKWSIISLVAAAALLGICATTIALEGSRNASDLLVFGMTALLILSAYAIIDVDRRGPVVVSILSIVALGLLYVIDVLPAHAGLASRRDLLPLAATSAALICGAVLCAAAVALKTGIAEAGLVDIEAARKRLELMQESASKAQGTAYETSLVISKTAEETIASLHKLEGLVSGTADGIVVLNQALNDTSRSNDKIVESQGLARVALASYAREVATESAAVEALYSSVTSLAESSRAKRKMVEKLLGLSSEAETRLASILRASDRMMDAAGRVSKLSSLITEVSDQTNLLAMNASIEAAHAGSAGKGFAVIAKQVRALSLEAAEGSQTISATLVEAGKSISETTNAAGAAVQFFRSVSDDLREIATIFEELLAGMQSMAKEASEILDSVRRIEVSNARTEEAVKTSESSIEQAKYSLETVLELASTIQSDSLSMMKAYHEMRAVAEGVRELGVRNIDRLAAKDIGLAEP